MGNINNENSATDSKNLKVKDFTTVKFEIWDTAGQERYVVLAPMYYRGAGAAIVVYDITSAESFNKATYWVKVPLNHVPEPTCKTASDWINQRSSDALGEFVLWCVDSIMSELSSQPVGVKGSKMVVQQTPKAQEHTMSLIQIPLKVILDSMLDELQLPMSRPVRLLSCLIVLSP